MKPSIGRIVIVPKRNAFNAECSPAIITRVWDGGDPANSDPAGVSVKVLPEGDAPFDASVRLFDDEKSARASGSSSIAWWPERV